MVGEAGTTAEAIELAASLQPQVILMDLHLPDIGGAAATATILAASPEVAVLVLTMHDDDAHLRDALRAGARGYLLKDSRSETIVDGIVAVHRGQMIFDKGVAQHLQSATGPASRVSRFRP